MKKLFKLESHIIKNLLLFIIFKVGKVISIKYFVLEKIFQLEKQHKKFEMGENFLNRENKIKNLNWNKIILFIRKKIEVSA